MPVLDNARHELFCQQIAQGKTLQDAYAAAGYNPNRSNASTLKSKQHISQRIDEILQERADITTEIMTRQVEVTRDSLLKDLEKARKIAEGLDQPNSMVMAIMGMAKITGNIIDRREVGDVGAFDGHTDEELTAEAARRARELGVAGPRLVEDGPKKVGVA